MNKGTILIIGGFDNTGGAGILADFSAIISLKVHPCVVVSNFAVQNNSRGFQCFAVSLKVIKLKLESIFSEFEIKYVKIGMVGNLKLAKFLYSFFKDKGIKIVLDTPLRSSSGMLLQKKEVVYMLSKIAFLITPNKEEFVELGGYEYFKTLKTNFLIKSSKVLKDEIIDELNLYVSNKYKVLYFPSKKLKLTKNIRGTGCGLASLITVFLFKKHSLESSIKNAKKHLFCAMKAAKQLKNVKLLSYS